MSNDETNQKNPMFICYEDPGPEKYVVLEATKNAINDFIRSTAKENSLASQDAVLMALANGQRVSGYKCHWYRVEPLYLAGGSLTKCEYSGAELGNVMFDAPLSGGAWCFMSKETWQKFGPGQLGVGLGQMYLKASNGKFYVSRGMITAPKPYHHEV